MKNKFREWLILKLGGYPYPPYLNKPGNVWKVTEVYRRGEKVAQSKPYRQGWMLYRNGLFFDFLKEDK